MREGGRGKKVVVGTLELAFEGYGFVVPEQKGVPDIFIPAHLIGDALHRDRVEITVVSAKSGKKEGRIVKILERGLTQLVGRFEIKGRSAVVITEDFRVRKQVSIPLGKDGGARHNEMVAVNITDYPSAGRPIRGEVIKRLGIRGSDATEMEILIAKHQIRETFPPRVLKDAEEAVRKFASEDTSGRTDLTGYPFTTIDGEDAKDFDDAVYAYPLGKDRVRVFISIADVSHFVREGSAMDTEALLRATSIYLPGKCIPMLPEDLSNGICSLVPNQLRFCFTAEFTIDARGAISDAKFYKSVIKSFYRMTYTEANNYLTHGRMIGAPKEVLSSLETLNLAAANFRKAREVRGSIDFDLPEPEVVLDLTGRPENIVKAERNAAHMLIEDLMIAANEAVAAFLSQKGYPCIYRVHDKPDPEKLLELNVLLKYLGHSVSIGRDPTPKKLSNIVKLVKGRPEERLINMLLLRSLAQAVYDTTNIGHFGLASRCYCHFTSPIRRYPDLIVHRLLSDLLKIERFRHARDTRYLKETAMHSSKMERRSIEAERESQRLYAAIFMRGKVGEIYDGLISHTAKKGVFVELIDYFVEGIIKPEDLRGDKFRYEQKNFSYVGRRSGRSIHIGDRIRVAVKEVSVEERMVYFELPPL